MGWGGVNKKNVTFACHSNSSEQEDGMCLCGKAPKFSGCMDRYLHIIFSILIAHTNKNVEKHEYS